MVASSTISDRNETLWKWKRKYVQFSESILHDCIESFNIISSKYGISSEKDRDIAVIIVEKPFQLSSYVSPVCLPSTKSFKIINGNALVSGSDVP